jgi:hypothetical protein
MVFTAIAIATVFLAYQDEPPPGVAMAERVSRAVEATVSSDCEQALVEAETRNAENLFIGASVCGRQAREDDAIYLTLAAQARAMADMELAVPAEITRAGDAATFDLSNMPAPPAGVIDVYAFIYAYGGGAGPTEFYRDVDRTNRLFERLRSWQPERPTGYDPGWVGSRSASDADYAASILANVEHRIGQLTPLALLLRDDAYFELQRESEALLEANNNTLFEGTPASVRFQEIEAAKSRRQQELGIAF